MNDVSVCPGTLRELRELSGLSQREVARRMGVTAARPGQIEQDFPNVRFNVVQAYVQAIGGRIEFTVPGEVTLWADRVVRDPRGPRDHGDRTQAWSDANSHPGSGDQ